MGMFDTYEPEPSIVCPWCGGLVKGFQGKDGPNALFLWRQGQKHPVDQPIDRDARIDPGRYVEFILPDSFYITGWCFEGHSFKVDCCCIEGVWTQIDLSAEYRMVEEAGRRRPPAASSESL